MSGFVHLLLTPFNLRYHPDDPTPLDPGWLVHRFTLFERFTLPSVRGQTARRFRWLVFFDAATPPPFRHRAEGLAEQGPFEPCFVADTSLAAMQALVRAHVPAGTAYVLTTRLDNDDALARTFVETVQAQFHPHPGRFVNFPEGYILKGEKLYAARRPSNAFLTRIEPAEALQTVWCRPHPRAGEAGPVDDVEAGPMWLQVVHGRNQRNRAVDCLRVPRGRLSERFAVEAGPAPPESGVAVRAERAWNGLALGLRRAGRLARRLAGRS